MMKKNTYICERMFPVVAKPEAKHQSILLLFQFVRGHYQPSEFRANLQQMPYRFNGWEYRGFLPRIVAAWSEF